MKVYKFDTIYPRTLFVANAKSDHPTTLTKRFTFFKNLPGWNVIDDGISDELDDAWDSSVAGCYAVQENSTGILGMLLIIFNSKDY